jgi:hypothetical protein
MIANQLGYEPFQARSTQRVVTRTRAAGEGIVGTIEWYDAAGAQRGERELHSERADCAAFARTLAFAVAVQIQLLAEDEEPKTAKVETTPEASAPKKPAASTARDRTSPTTALPVKDRPPWRFFGGIGMTGNWGILPGLIPSGRLFAGVRRGLFGLELGGEASLPGQNVDDSGNGFDHHAAFGTFAGCGFPGPFSACVVGKVGRLRVRGVGVDVPRSQAGEAALLGARLSLNPELGPFSGALRLEVLAPLVSWGVRLNGGEVFRTSPVAVALGADVGVVF